MISCPIVSQGNWIRIGITAFIALLFMAFVSTPKNFKSRIDEAGSHLVRTNKISPALLKPRGNDKSTFDAGYYSISHHDKAQLVDLLRKMGMPQVSGPRTSYEGAFWFNWPNQFIPRRPYQHVWITEGSSPQVEFQPDLK